jgi:glucose 1-dehydrogenase
MPSMTSTSDLSGRIALVTGASSGIGKAVAERLARDGAAVVVNYVGDADGAGATVRAITAAGGSALAVHADVSDEEAVEAMYREARAAFGAPVDLLVANAGVEKPFSVVEMPLAEWQKVIDVNLTGAFLCTRRFARDLIAAGRRGTMVAVSSVHEVIPWPQFSHYCASKGGLKLFVQSVARELAPHGIRVASVAPGAIQTPINKELEEDEEKRADVIAQIPWGRIGEADEVAAAVAWLSSDEASYVVGTTLFVDGGMTLYAAVNG